MRQIKCLILLCMGCLMFGACMYPSPSYDSEKFSEDEIDSLQFAAKHHYTVNYNFQVLVDSMSLVVNPMDSDSVRVYRNDLIVVADIAMIPADSIDSVYVKVAHDQETQGWVREKDLLKNVVPDDPISSFIHAFSTRHNIWFMSLIVGVSVLFLLRRSRKKSLRMVHFHDVGSPYPTLFCMMVAIAASFYGTIQHFVPDTWVQFYYNPTLNPFILPFGMACFIACAWAILLMGLATVDEVLHHISWADAVVYLLGLGAFCMFLYLFFTFITSYYIGYLFLTAYLWFALHSCHYFWGYRCGHCGSYMHKKTGICPHCGALNV